MLSSRGFNASLLAVNYSRMGALRYLTLSMIIYL